MNRFLTVRIWGVLFVALALAGCQHTTATTTKTLCAPWRAITYSGTHDTATTVRQIQVHNKTGATLHCWAAG